MAEYIERSDAAEYFERSKQTMWHKDDVAATISSNSNIPTADVVEVVHGEWECPCFDISDYWRCSACGEEWFFEYDPTEAETKVNYCPMCGAKMDGERRSDNA